MRIFIDANVLFTAAYSPQGKAFLLLTSMRGVLITSEYAADEARRNISLKRPEALARLEKILKQIKLVPCVNGSSSPINLPTKDQPIFMAALMAKATHLLTGDLKDFGQHMNQPKKTVGVLIQTVADFLNSL
jgi:uncharacterized protein